MSDCSRSRANTSEIEAALSYLPSIRATGGLQQHYDDDIIAELTMIIAWENASSRFNRAFRIPSLNFFRGQGEYPEVLARKRVRDRKFADSPLEEAVLSELVSEPQIPC